MHILMVLCLVSAVATLPAPKEINSNPSDLTESLSDEGDDGNTHVAKPSPEGDQSNDDNSDGSDVTLRQDKEKSCEGSCSAEKLYEEEPNASLDNLTSETESISKLADKKELKIEDDANAENLEKTELDASGDTVDEATKNESESSVEKSKNSNESDPIQNDPKAEGKLEYEVGHSDEKSYKNTPKDSKDSKTKLKDEKTDSGEDNYSAEKTFQKEPKNNSSKKSVKEGEEDSKVKDNINDSNKNNADVFPNVPVIVNLKDSNTRVPVLSIISWLYCHWPSFPLYKDSDVVNGKQSFYIIEVPIDVKASN